MKRYVRSLVILVVLMGAVALPASAVDDIVIPIDTVVRSPEGELTQLASVAVESELIGSVCTVSAEADNNASVHPSNDIIVSSGSDQELLLDVEGVGGGVTVASNSLTLGETVVLTLRMGSDRVFSGGITVTVDCSTAGTTTTTTEPESSTTTAPPVGTSTTTTAPPESTTTTAPPESTTTTAPPDSSTTTAPPDGTSTSTTIPPTTTTAPATTTTDVQDQGTTTTSPTQVLGSQIEQTDELPFTGISTGMIAALGFGLIATGFFVRRLATENRSAEAAD
ncbi:MAG: hypothetical protein OEM97_07745 [Acidimicrobiia bacterium]|nr:hypothetical protein [Acidimicrobiia bacterium]